MRNILITGASGFVGSHLAEQLQSTGDQLFTLVRKTTNKTHLQKLGVHLLEAELTNSSALESAIQSLQNQNIQLDFVIHCAGMTKGRNLEEFMLNNCEGTGHLLNALQKYQPQLKKFIFISSLAASGPTQLGNVIQLEDAKPITDYGRSKLAAEALVKKSPFPFVTFRPTAVYGPREKDIFTLFTIVKKGLHPLLGKGKQQLTFIYVKDLVQLIVNSLESEKINETYFVSDGNVYGKEVLGRLIKKELKKKVFEFTIPLGVVKSIAYVSETISGWRNQLSPLNLEKYQELKAQSWVCEVETTFEGLNFSPQYDLERGVAETTAWYVEEGWI